MKAWQRYWQGLSPRDQRVLLIGIVFVSLVVLWFGAWEPLRKARDDARVRLAASTIDLATMRDLAPRLRALAAPATASNADGRSLLVLVDSTARASQVGDGLLRVEPVAGDQVRVYFESASFDALVEWLGALESGHGVRILELSINRAAGVGRVDARVFLQRGTS
ncbi:MAG TPA: type II secretion system protein M [Chiayiivirga sp.]|nr:type II secretion system protein M [Chiayiivirga sp.]